MNESGGPVSALLRFFSVPVERLVVVHDELDLDAGTVRLKRGGGEGGHNGLRSISASLGHQGLPPGAGRHRPPARAGWTPPTSSCATSPRPSARSCRSSSTRPPTRWSQLVALGLLDAQQRVHAPEVGLVTTADAPNGGTGGVAVATVVVLATLGEVA